jgi:hypothetical protein
VRRRFTRQVCAFRGIGIRDRREQLPDETPAKAGISEDVLFFQEAEKSLAGVCYGGFYINYGFV